MNEGEERVYTIPLKKARRKPRSKRAPAAVRVLREFLLRHTKAKDVKISNDVNEFVWERGIHKFPPRVKVRVKIKEGIAYAELLK